MEFQDIEERRARLGIKQSELCREARMPDSTYVRIKKGESSPTIRTLSRLRTALAAISLRQPQDAGQTGRAA
jgi:predicted transcriptional regulator